MHSPQAAIHTPPGPVGACRRSSFCSRMTMPLIRQLMRDILCPSPRQAGMHAAGRAACASHPAETKGPCCMLCSLLLLQGPGSEELMTVPNFGVDYLDYLSATTSAPTCGVGCGMGRALRRRRRRTALALPAARAPLWQAAACAPRFFSHAATSRTSLNLFRRAATSQWTCLACTSSACIRMCVLVHAVGRGHIRPPCLLLSSSHLPTLGSAGPAHPPAPRPPSSAAAMRNGLPPAPLARERLGGWWVGLGQSGAAGCMRVGTSSQGHGCRTPRLQQGASRVPSPSTPSPQKPPCGRRRRRRRAVDRRVTPFVVVFFHASIYHSYYQQYKQADTFREVMEPLFVRHAVDLVLAGHVHRCAIVIGCGRDWLSTLCMAACTSSGVASAGAPQSCLSTLPAIFCPLPSYERTFPVVNYTRDDCGPVYITIG